MGGTRDTAPEVLGVGVGTSQSHDGRTTEVNHEGGVVDVFGSLEGVREGRGRKRIVLM